jgi:hypothetical protein
MFNPYVAPVTESLRPLAPPKEKPERPERAERPPEKSQGLGAILGRLGQLDSDDMLIALLIFLLARDQEPDSLGPMVAAGIYLLM